MKYLAFVYGSLKQGFGNHRLLKASTFLGEAKLSQCGAMYSLGGFPAVTLGKRVSPIHGELYEIDENTLDALDSLEGHPHFYQRTEVDVLQEDEDGVYRVRAFVYLMEPNSGYLRGDPIKDGVWHDPRTRKAV
ncbi:MAG TPA: gamma-glutamylcyclotransferase family protein [Candidatus Obscuribacterales bacterium]